MTTLVFKPSQPELHVDNIVLLFQIFETFNRIGELLMPMASSTAFFSMYLVWVKAGKLARDPALPDIPGLNGPEEIEFLRRIQVYATEMIGQAEALQINGQVPS